MKRTARQTVLHLLLKMGNTGYSNILLDKAFSESELTLQDKKFAASLFYGVLERKITLDYVINCYKEIEKIDNDILQILRMGVYQLIYMPSIPPSAAVNESVELVKFVHKNGVSGFINAILRSFLRDDMLINMPKDEIMQDVIKYSCPEWLVKKWVNEYGKEITIRILESTISRPETFIRVNNTVTTTSKLSQILTADGIENEIINIIPNCIKVHNIGSIEKNTAFKNGLFHVQDIASQLCCHALKVNPTDTVFDVCAAPGGKSFTIAEEMDNYGSIFSFDLHEKRIKLIESGAKRLMLSNITAAFGNGKEFNSNLPFADKILCDVPCSGLGVISKKPEIKYKKPEELAALPEIQYDILENSSKYLKSGGELVYSTCSLSREENDLIIDKFLKNNKGFSGIAFLEEVSPIFGNFKTTIFPGDFSSDGFFIAKLIKR